MTKAVLLMKGNEYSVSSSSTLSLVFQSGCSVYDCEFAALAQQLKIFLVTSDKKIFVEFSQDNHGIR